MVFLLKSHKIVPTHPAGSEGPQCISPDLAGAPAVPDPVLSGMHCTTVTRIGSLVGSL